MPVKTVLCQRKSYVNCAQKRRGFLWARRHAMDHNIVETCIVVRRVSISGLFWNKWPPCAPDQKLKGPTRLLSATSPKARVCHGMGCVSALGKGNFQFCDGTINVEKHIETLLHISTRQCKTTFCTYFKGTAVKNRGCGYCTCLRAVQTWPQ